MAGQPGHLGARGCLLVPGSTTGISNESLELCVTGRPNATGDRARQLAYLLYGICDRKKWADEAAAYNMLVTAWPTIERLAQSQPEGDSAPRMF